MSDTLVLHGISVRPTLPIIPARIFSALKPHRVGFIGRAFDSDRIHKDLGMLRPHLPSYARPPLPPSHPIQGKNRTPKSLYQDKSLRSWWPNSDVGS